MNKNALDKALKSAIGVVLPGTLFSLLFCTIFLGNGIFEKLLPVWLGIIFTAISFLFARISFIANRLWLKIVISAVFVIGMVIFLRFLK